MKNYTTILSPYNEYLERDVRSQDFIANPFNYNHKGGVGDFSVTNQSIPNIDEGLSAPNKVLTIDQIAGGSQVIFTSSNLGAGVISGIHLADLRIKNYIESSIYIPGKAGFKLWGDTGNAEFNDVIVRGNILGKKKNYSDDTSGYFIGQDTDGIYKMYLGDGTDSLKWNGSSLAISGAITATSGYIGGAVITSSAVSSSNFVSGPLGAGWSIDNSGTAEFQDVTIRGSITTSVFKKSTISAVNGQVLISQADVLDADMTALDASTLTISGDTTFSVNEVIRLKDGTDDEWMLVTGQQTSALLTISASSIYGITGAGTDMVAQNFQTSSSDVILDSVDINLSKFGNPTGNLTVKIFASTGTFGSTALPTGSALATSDNLDTTTIATSKSSFTVNFSGANRITLTANTDYWLAINYSGGDGSNIVYVYYKTTQTYSGDFASSVDSGVNWSGPNNYNLDCIINVVDSNNTTYTVTRDLAGSYSADNNPVWKKGTAVVSTGNGGASATGYIVLDSSSSYSPYIDIYGRNSITYTDTSLHVRLGWLKGITDADVGLSATDTWGLYTDNAYIKGTIVSSSGKIGGWTINATGIFGGNASESLATISLNSSTPSIRIGVASGDERIDLKDTSIIGYAKDGTTPIYKFLNEATNNNIMSLFKVDNTPSYGNAFFIEDKSTDTNAAMEINSSGTGASGKTNFLSTSSLTTATDLNVFKSTAGTKGTLVNIDNQAGAITTTLNVINAYAGGNAFYASNTNASNTSVALGLTQAGTGSAFYINKDNSNYCLEIDQDANDANDCVGVAMNILNTGAGNEFAFRFDGSEIDSTAGGNTQVRRVKVNYSGTTGYIYVYSN